jgi:dTDP-4-dehydrorhamnose reductase
MTEKFLIIGGDSLIGHSLYHHLIDLKKNVTRTTRRRLENLNSDQVYLNLSCKPNTFKEKYDCAIFCAGITNMDFCQKNQEISFRINVDATVTLAKQLIKQGCRIIFISSSTVFNGNINNPNEDEAYCPANEYGFQKMIAEKKLVSLDENVIIVRITKLFSPNNGIFSTIIKNIKEKNYCEVFNNLFISLISIRYLCHSLITMAYSHLRGIFHLSGDEDISYSNFAITIANYFGITSDKIIPVKGELIFKLKFASLGMNRTSTLLNIFPEPMDLLLARSFNGDKDDKKL